MSPVSFANVFNGTIYSRHWIVDLDKGLRDLAGIKKLDKWDRQLATICLCC